MPHALLAPRPPGVPFPDEGHGPYRFMRGAMARARSGFEAGIADPVGAQRRRLRVVIEGAAGTAFGRAHDLDAVARQPDDALWASWRAAVPVRPHAELVPWLDRVAAGEPSVLTSAPVRMLLETSGTTGRPKWLPVTDAWARTYGDAQELWVLGMLRDDEGLRHGRTLSIVSSAAHARSPGGLTIGANTGRMFLAQPWWLRLRAPVPYRAYLLEDPEVRAYTILRIALAADIVAWATANPSTLLLYCRRLAAWWDDLRADVAEGTLRRGPAAALSSADRRRLWWWLRRRDPKRLGEDPHPARVWPLRRISCWTGGSASYFLDRLEGALGAALPVREAGINASEGYIGVAVDDGGPVAHLGGHALEFVPLDGGDALLAHELDEGREYRLVISTEAGLYRYDLGDVVRVTGWCGGAPRLAFIRKAGSVLNATGEKVTEDQVLAAAGEAFPGAVGLSVSLGWAEVPAQRIALETAGPPPTDAAQRYDAALMRLNVEYASKRESGRLAPPVLRPVPPGTFLAWRAARIRAGAPEAQVKDPVLLDPERWDALVAGREGE